MKCCVSGNPHICSHSSSQSPSQLIHIMSLPLQANGTSWGEKLSLFTSLVNADPPPPSVSLLLFFFPFSLLSHLASPWQWDICVVMDSVMSLLLPHLHSLLLNPAWSSGPFCVSFPNSEWINRLAVSESVTAAGSGRGQGGGGVTYDPAALPAGYDPCVSSPRRSLTESEDVFLMDSSWN